MPTPLNPNDNRMLAVLSPEAQQYLLERSVAVELPIRSVLYEAEETPTHAYFLTSGMASIVTSMVDGATAEVGVVGRVGFVGGIYLLGPSKVYTQSFVQLDARGFKIPMPELRKAFASIPEIRDRFLEFVQQEFALLGQIAGCNRLHEAEERLARWLLMARDRTGGDVLEFTQEFLALMLGSRRTTVTLVAGTLQRDGLIEYSRGRVKVLDPEGLQAAACDCYRISRRLFGDLYSKRSSEFTE